MDSEENNEYVNIIEDNIKEEFGDIQSANVESLIKIIDSLCKSINECWTELDNLNQIYNDYRNKILGDIKILRYLRIFYKNDLTEIERSNFEKCSKEEETELLFKYANKYLITATHDDIENFVNIVYISSDYTTIKDIIDGYKVVKERCISRLKTFVDKTINTINTMKTTNISLQDFNNDVDIFIKAFNGLLSTQNDINDSTYDIMYYYMKYDITDVVNYCRTIPSMMLFIERDKINEGVIEFINKHKLHEIASIKYISIHHRLPPKEILPKENMSPMLKCEIDKINEDKQIVKRLIEQYSTCIDEMEKCHGIVADLKRLKELESQERSYKKDMEKYVSITIDLIMKFKDDWIKHVTYCDDKWDLMRLSKVLICNDINKDQFDINYYLLKYTDYYYLYCKTSKFMTLYLEKHTELKEFINEFINKYSLHEEASEIYIAAHKRLPPKELLPSKISFMLVNYSLKYLSPTDITTLKQKINEQI